MECWVEEIFHVLLNENSIDLFFEKVILHAQSIGFEYCAYGLRSPVPITRPNFEIISNYPFTWQKKYQNNGYLYIDPTVQHGIKSHLPVLWSEKLFLDTREFWEEAKTEGVCHGWSLSTRSQNGFVGMLSLARGHDPIADDELSIKSPQMAWLSHACHIGMMKFLRAKMAPELTIKLTDREMEVLKWTAEGKTSNEIADILNISYGTINFHIANSISKLQTVNKTAAVVRAAMLGLL